MKKINIAIITVCFLCITALLGCGKSNEAIDVQVDDKLSDLQSEVAETTTENSIEETENTEAVRTDIPDGMAVSPYTGLYIDEALASQRPVAIMIENTQACLPQYNIGRADIIYECLTEAAITRLMAVMHDYSDMDIVGNIRSCRHYYTHFAYEYDAIYVHSGASPIAKKTVLSNGYIDNIDGTTGKAGVEYYRDDRDGRKSPHNLYISSKGISNNIEKYNYRTTLEENYTSPFKFAIPGQENMLENGSAAAVLSLYYNSPKPYFIYNEEDKLYYRYEYGDKQIDGMTGEQLTAKNIIVLNMRCEVLDKKGRRDFTDIGEGTGLFLTNGKYIDIIWKRASINDITHYYDLDGNEIVLNPGRTWVNICESDSTGSNKIYQTKEEFN